MYILAMESPSVRFWLNGRGRVLHSRTRGCSVANEIARALVGFGAIYVLAWRDDVRGIGYQCGVI